MSITVEATYENGMLRLDEPLPLGENERIKVTIHQARAPDKAGYGLVHWTGSIEDLDTLIEDVENDPLEGP